MSDGTFLGFIESFTSQECIFWQRNLAQVVYYHTLTHEDQGEDEVILQIWASKRIRNKKIDGHNFAHFFSYLLKSMNYMHSPKTVREVTDFSHNVSPKADQRAVRNCAHQLTSKAAENLRDRASPSLSDDSEEYYDKYRDNKYNSNEIRFSRFSCWHLPEMAENNAEPKQNNTDQPRYFRYLEESQSESQDDEGYMMTPSAYNWAGLIEKDNQVSTPPMQNYTYSKRNEQKLPKPKQTGLRKLSGKAYKIVKELGEVTYKEVAMRLIKQIIEDQAEFDDEKEENNIKRRVYDALNVLIAMGILTKQGKNIAYGLDPNVESLNLIHKEKKEKCHRELDSKKKQLARKKQHRRRLSNRLKSLAQLMNRNKFLQAPESSRIPMSYFVGIQVDSTSNMKMSESRDFFRAKLSEQSVVLENMDFIHKIFSDKNK